jgi:hypothetical protein
MKLIWVNVAENDDQGRKSGRATVFHFGDIASLWSNDPKGMAFSHVKNKNRFRFNRRQYVYYNYQHWAGNMMYNSYLLPTIEACYLFNEIHKTGNYHFEDILCEVEDILKSDGLILQGDFENIMDRAWT